jgi:hypothetical protein
MHMKQPLHAINTTINQRTLPQSVDPLLCGDAGGLMVLSGVPIPAVIGAGQATHAAGVCP